jgi:protein involved in sex pheromone biosynthesis
MKVKIVLSLFATLVFLASCWAKNDTESWVKTNDSGAVEKEENVIPSSSIGGWLGEPEAEKEIFKN